MVKKKPKASPRPKQEKDTTRDLVRSYAAAAVEYDPRLATATRDRQVENLGASNRVRSPSYARLFVQASHASPLRIAACAAFDSLWHNAHRGDYPEPRFEPSGGNSSTSAPHPEHRAAAKLMLSKVQRSMEPELYEVLEKRVVEHVSFRDISDQTSFSRAKVHVAFQEATDKAANALGLVADDKPGRIRKWRQGE